MKIARLMTLVTCAGLAAPALAQDSVSSTGAGDALDAYNTSTQVVKFSTKLTPFTTNLGNTYGIVPLIKASDSLPVDSFFSHLISGQAMSRSIVDNTLTTGTYATWTTPGQGVNPQNNTAPGSVNAPASGLKSVGVSFAEFGNSANNIIAGLVSFDPSTPDTLYVDRIVAATNQNSSTPATDTAQFGMGVIDANLNVQFRADGFGVGGAPAVTGDNMFRVNADLRTNGNLNAIQATGGTHAGTTDNLLLGSGTTHSPGTQIEEAIGGPVGFGPNFNGDLAFNNYASTTSTHLTSTFPGLVNSSDQRGTFGYSPINPLGGVATSAFLGRTGASSIYLGVMGLNADASPASVAHFPAPMMISDPIDGYAAPYAEFRHYRSQMAFRGPSGAAAISQDAVTDEVLVAAVFDIDCVNCGSGIAFGAGSATAPIQGISVARFDAADPAGTIEWNLAAWVDGDTGVGKPVFNSMGQQIGELTAIAVFEVAGPSISGVSMDAAGNIYFVAPFFDYGPDMMIGGVDDDFDSALFRGVYDSATGGYRLEKLIQTGNVFNSANTGLNYVITFLDIADSNSTSSGTFFGHNASFDGYPGQADPTNPASAGNVGGIAVAADMTYDSNNDGQFDEASGDEGYNFLFYIAPLGEGITDCNNNGVDDATDIANGTSTDINGDGIPDECPGQSTRLCADVNNDGSVTPADFSAWLSAYNASNYRADQNNGGTGAISPADFTAWLANYNLGVNGPTCLN